MNMTSLKYKQKVNGFLHFIGAVDTNFEANGHGKCFLNKGRVFIGNFELYRMKIGKLYELQHNRKISIF
jgi:hypothetical protein